MKYITYIEFRSGWRPPAIRATRINPIKIISSGISKNNNPYEVWIGQIDEQDAIMLKLKDPKTKIFNNSKCRAERK
jgi:hypothetical protein